jgi:hypothetical protein
MSHHEASRKLGQECYYVATTPVQTKNNVPRPGTQTNKTENHFSPYPRSEGCQVKSRAQKADGQKADINNPIKQKDEMQKADMSKSRYVKKPICQKADMSKSRQSKSRSVKKPIFFP